MATPPTPAKNPTIDTVMFDLGRVLIDIDTNGFLKAFSDRFGVPPARIGGIALQAQFLEDWESGRLSQADVRKYLNQSLGVDLTPVELRTWILTHVPNARELPGMYAMVVGLKQAGYRVIGLSNIAAMTLAYLNRHSAAVQALDELYASCELELFKPDPDIYRVVLAAEHKRPEQVVFIDDMQANIDSAAKLGLAVVLGAGPQKVAAGLRALGIQWQEKTGK